MVIGFDIVSDLNLSPDDSFNWENKATSLYCIVAGNISSDIRTLILTLAHISQFYQGVFFIPGSLEYDNCEDIFEKTTEIISHCKKIKNLAVLYQHVVIVDGIAVLGANGWYGNTLPVNDETDFEVETKRHEDIHYLKNSIEKLQKHLDVKKIILVTNCLPGEDLYFGEVPDYVFGQLSPNFTLDMDTEHKISHWVFGTYEKIVDTNINGINYVNNSKFSKNPYWAKRIDVKI